MSYNEFSSDIYEKITPRQARVLEEMRAGIAGGKRFGVTLMGNRLTLRFDMPEDTVDARYGRKPMMQVHMVILETGDPLWDPDGDDEDPDIIPQ